MINVIKIIVFEKIVDVGSILPCSEFLDSLF